MTTRTPPRITDKVLELCSMVKSGACPFVVPIRPERDSIPHECFENVKAKVSRNGGSLQHGWAIWEWVDVLLEAEFHAVWVSPDGDMVCVSPHNTPDTTLLFLPDDTRSFNGLDRLDNLKLPLRNEKVVADFIHVTQALMAAQNRLTRGRFGVVKVPVTPELRKLAERYVTLRKQIDALPPIPRS